MIDESSLCYLIKENEEKQQQEETEVDVNMTLKRPILTMILIHTNHYSKKQKSYWHYSMK